MTSRPLSVVAAVAAVAALAFGAAGCSSSHQAAPSATTEATPTTPPVTTPTTAPGGPLMPMVKCQSLTEAVAELRRTKIAYTLNVIDGLSAAPIKPTTTAGFQVADSAPFEGHPIETSTSPVTITLAVIPPHPSNPDYYKVSGCHPLS